MFRMRVTQLTLFAAAAFGMAGCTAEEASDMHVRIMPAIETRVTGLHFDTNDRIGLTIRKGSENYVENRLMTYTGSSFTSPDLLWYNDLNEKSTLMAYYPYTEAGVPTSFTVAADQQSGPAASDLLAAVRTEVTPGSAPVAMVFHHLLTQLTIRIDNRSSATVSSVRIGGLIPTATVNFQTPAATVAEGGTAADITAFCETANSIYRIILVPQQAAITLRVATSDGKAHTKTLAPAILTGGKRYDLAVTLTNIDISLSLSGDINDWVNGGSLGDNGEELVYDGVTYKTATIDGKVWMAENLRYKPAGAQLQNGVWNPDGNEANVATQGLLYNYATATVGATAVNGTPLQGICPSGWHIPSAAELTALSESAAIPANFFCCAAFWNNNLGIYDSKREGLFMSCDIIDGKWQYLDYLSTNGSLSIAGLKPECGISLRCVKDTK